MGKRLGKLKTLKYKTRRGSNINNPTTTIVQQNCRSSSRNMMTNSFQHVLFLECGTLAIDDD
jgi:hypothetical protein